MFPRMLEYSLNLQNVSFSAVRTVRVLRPLRAINRVPSECSFLTLLTQLLTLTLGFEIICPLISQELYFSLEIETFMV